MLIQAYTATRCYCNSVTYACQWYAIAFHGIAPPGGCGNPKTLRSNLCIHANIPSVTDTRPLTHGNPRSYCTYACVEHLVHCSARGDIVPVLHGQSVRIQIAYPLPPGPASGQHLPGVVATGPAPAHTLGGLRIRLSLFPGEDWVRKSLLTCAPSAKLRVIKNHCVPPGRGADNYHRHPHLWQTSLSLSQHQIIPKFPES